MSYALTVNEVEGIWRVYCVECRTDMGTMTIAILKRALAFSVNKGGVMCPKCRARRCERCGLLPRLEIPPSKKCFFCEEEEKEGMVKTEKSIVQSCLDNQNSRNSDERE